MQTAAASAFRNNDDDDDDDANNNNTAAAKKKRRTLPAWMLQPKPKPQPQPLRESILQANRDAQLERLRARIERAELAKDALERLLDPPALDWNLFDYDGQEAELREQARAGAFVLDESELMDHMTVDELLELLADAGDPLLLLYDAKALAGSRYAHDPALLLRRVETALARMRAAFFD